VRRFLPAVLVAAAAAFAWWEGGLHQSSTAAHVSVLVTNGVFLLGAVSAGVGRQAAPVGVWVRGPLSVRRHLAEDTAATVAVVVWIVLVLVPIGWDLNSFVHQSHDLPTVSWIVGHATSSHGGRAVVFALWLTLGGTLALGWRRPR
jgi:hypothetical protein